MGEDVGLRRDPHGVALATELQREWGGFVVDDFNQVEAGDAILSTFPGARATREDGGQTKVLVGPDQLHRKYVLFLGEYARIPDPDYVVTTSASKLRGAFDRGVLHAIDAMSARRRGAVGLAPHD